VSSGSDCNICTESDPRLATILHYSAAGKFPGASCAGRLPTTADFQAHSAPLQATFYYGSAFPARYDGALCVAFHGSWNRQPPTGYKVVVVFTNAAGVVTGMEDFITGWLTDATRVNGRPVGVAVGADGSLFVSDDTGSIFRVRYGS
jgi:glucose/arabinose dehydrogenase